MAVPIFGAESTNASVSGTSTGLTGSSITVSGISPFLLVALDANPGLTSPAVTFNGVSMTQIGTGFADTGTERFYIFGLLNPASGSHTPIATWSSVTSDVSLVSAYWTLVNQVALPSNTQNTTQITTGPKTGTITVDSAANPFVVALVGGFAGTLSATAGATLRGASGTVNPQWCDSNANTVTNSTTYDMSFSWTGGSTPIHILQLELNGVNAFTLTAAQASFSLTGQTLLFSKAHAYTVALATGLFSLVGQAIAVTAPLWTRQTKHTSTFTNQPKD